MIIWVNGPFGGGKTVVASELIRRIPASTLFDPEDVGFMLRNILPDREVDFQDLPPWRPLVAAAASEIVNYTRQSLIVPMSLLRKEYANEIFTAISRRGIAMHHVVLDADVETITRRILDDTNHTDRVREFRLSKLGDYEQARATWLNSAHQLIDTKRARPADVADEIIAAVRIN